MLHIYVISTKFINISYLQNENLLQRITLLNISNNGVPLSYENIIAVSGIMFTNMFEVRQNSGRDSYFRIKKGLDFVHRELRIPAFWVD